MARLDFILDLSQDASQVTGTALLATYPLEDPDPFNGGGTVLGTFTIAGELIKP